MRRIISVSMILYLAFSLSACGVSQNDYDALAEENAFLQEQLESMEAEVKSLQVKYDSEKERLQTDLESIQAEYDSYKAEMEPFETLSVAEAEARQIEADRIIAEQKAAEEASAAAEAAALAAEEAKGYETGVTYDNIARTPDEYEGKKVKFKGKVIQLIENSDSIQIRLAINKDYNKVVFCEYDPSIVDSRVLEDDIITIYGVSANTISYQSTLGGQITIPAIIVDRIDQ